MADHFAYDSLDRNHRGGFVGTLRPRFLAGTPWLRRSAAAVVIAVLGVLAWRQCTVYADAETLYRATLDGNPSCYLCLNNLGTLGVARGETDVAIERFEAALRVQPQAPETHDNLANLLMERGDTGQRDRALSPFAGHRTAERRRQDEPRHRVDANGTPAGREGGVRGGAADHAGLRTGRARNSQRSFGDLASGAKRAR